VGSVRPVGGRTGAILAGICARVVIVGVVDVGVAR
jgi:hypothetical protein